MLPHPLEVSHCQEFQLHIELLQTHLIYNCVKYQVIENQLIDTIGRKLTKPGDCVGPSPPSAP